MKRAGFVLVGGRASRMGRDKALLRWDGAPLAGLLAGRVREAVGSATLVGPPEKYAHLGFPCLPDEVPGRGPLGGIVSALAASGAEWNLVVACDMPLLTVELLGALAAAAEASGGECLAPRSPEGRLEPLCAVYHRDCLPVLREALAAGRYKLTEAIAGTRLALWPATETACFRNLNTPQDWDDHRRCLQEPA